MVQDTSAAAKSALSNIVVEEPAALPAKPGQIVVAKHLRRHAGHPLRDRGLPERLSELRSVARDPEPEAVLEPEAEFELQLQPQPQPQPAAEHRESEAWSAERIALVQRIWGKGFTTPGGTEAILDLVKPLNLQRRMRVLELGAGLGGAGRILARKMGVHVTGLECNARLAKAGMALSRKAWLARRAPVYRLGRPDLKTPLGSYDCFLARNFLFSGARRAWMLRLVGAMLNRHGQLLITDFVVPSPGERSPAIKRWLASEPEAALPWATADYANRLASMGLHVRIDDMTDAACATIRRSWADHLMWLRALGKEHRPAQVLVKEAERWARRVKLLEAGELGVCRIHAARELLDLPPTP